MSLGLPLLLYWKMSLKHDRNLRTASCCSVAQSCPTLCYPMDWSTPGFPVLHYLLEFSQTHAHRVSDAIQPSHPLSPTSSAFNLSQHQGLFQCWLFASGGQSTWLFTVPFDSDSTPNHFSSVKHFNPKRGIWLASFSISWGYFMWYWED